MININYKKLHSYGELYIMTPDQEHICKKCTNPKCKICLSESNNCGNVIEFAQ